ncbi:MAG: 5-bromo-4-chloroindolyl phosphate hydrolysis family protein [Clostridia bacterium]|nr:5-bromo-4-chloroindolyl phosphate hydrolysis family protein [Clostridia bacterium]
MAKREKSRKEKRNTTLGFVLTAAGLMILAKPFNLIGIAIVAGISYLVGKTVGVMSSGLDLTTHNRQDQVKEKEYEAVRMTGDELADRTIQSGQQLLAQIREANDAIPDQELTRRINEIEDKCTRILETIAEKPGKASSVRKFMNYYLPTTLKMVQSYRTMQDRGLSAAAMYEARATLLRGTDMIQTACQKQLDNLYKDTLFDVSTDIDVLEQMLRRDGFTDSDFTPEAVETAASDLRDTQSAAAAQLMSGTPVIDPGAVKNTERESYYQLLEKRSGKQ